MNVNIFNAGLSLVRSLPLGGITNVSGALSLAGKIINPGSIGGQNGKTLEWLVTGLLTGKGVLDTTGQAQSGILSAHTVGASDTVSQHISFGENYLASTLLAATSGLLPTKLKIAARVASLAISAKTATHSRLVEAAEGVNPNDPLRHLNIMGRTLFHSASPYGGVEENYFLWNWLGVKDFAKKDINRGLVSVEKFQQDQPQRTLRFVDKNGMGENPFAWITHGGHVNESI